MDGMNPYSEKNAASLQDLAIFVESLSDQQLAAPMPAEWTVAGVLAHLAFWDFRAVTLIEKWQKEGIGSSPNDTDVVNEATRPFFNALAPEQTVELVLRLGRQVDEMIDSLDAEFLKLIEEKGTTVRLDRAHHRYCHLDEMKSVLNLTH